MQYDSYTGHSSLLAQYVLLVLTKSLQASWDVMSDEIALSAEKITHACTDQPAWVPSESQHSKSIDANAWMVRQHDRKPVNQLNSRQDERISLECTGGGHDLRQK